MEQFRKKRFADFVKPQAPAYFVSVFLAIVGVFFGLLPYDMVYRMLISISGAGDVRAVFIYAALILLSFALQILMHSFSTAISHKTAFSIEGSGDDYLVLASFAARRMASSPP